MRKKRLAASLLALSLCFSLAACSGGSSATPAPESDAPETTAPVETDSGESDLAYVQTKGTLVVGMTDFAPMDYKDENGEWIGFDADMAKAFAESLGVDVEFLEINWDNKLMELDTKGIDVIWNGMTINDEVEAGASDACVIDLLMAGAMIGEGTSYPDLTYTVQLNDEEYGVAFRKGSDLVDAFNEFWASAYADGTVMETATTYGVQESVIEK